MEQRERRVQKVLAIAIVGAIALLVAAALVGSLREVDADEVPAQVAVAESGPPAETVAICNRYAANATSRAALPGGADAAAASDGAVTEDSAAGDLAGGARGTIVGLSYENSKKESARDAYRACMIREGYSS
jgi:hypothetical protein